MPAIEMNNPPSEVVNDSTPQTNQAFENNRACWVGRIVTPCRGSNYSADTHLKIQVTLVTTGFLCFVPFVVGAIWSDYMHEGVKIFLVSFGGAAPSLLLWLMLPRLLSITIRQPLDKETKPFKLTRLYSFQFYLERAARTY